MKERTKPKGVGMAATVLLATLLIAAVIAPAMGATIPTSESVIITAPISPMQSDGIYSIPPGSVIDHSADGTTTVYAPNGTCILTAQDSKADMIGTPSGKSLPATHLHQVPSGSRICTVGDGVTKVYMNETCILTVVNQDQEVNTIPDVDGWIESSYDWSVDELWEFNAYWHVPSSPPSPESGTIDFLFNAIEPSTADAIVQPVLEWNQGGSGRWTGSAWTGSGGDYYHSDPIDVSVGDKIKGILAWDDDYNSWLVDVHDMTTGEKTFIHSHNVGDTSLAVFTALEGYGVEDDTDVPGDTTFYDMSFRDSDFNTVDIEWEKHIMSGVPLTGLEVESSSDEWVKLHTAN
ncbi:MAG: hypothetical protein U9N36_10070 [Euryarchaeota archaeon]|nr:hypothetical protein [Euryarchaeota archaeon]